MANEKKESVRMKNDSMRNPLFTGDRKRDTAVSEGERVAEISRAIFDRIVRKPNKNAK